MRPIERRTLQSLLAVAAFTAMTALASAASLHPAVIANVPRGAGMHDLGRAGADVRVRIALILHYRNEGQLDQLLEEQGDPASPLFSRFLSSREFNAYFAPSLQTYREVAQRLSRAGFKVTGTWRNRTVIDASAPAPTVDRYFQTEIHRVAIDGAGVHYANPRPALMPDELREAVFSVLGFDDIEWFKPLYQIARGDVRGNPFAPIGPPLHGPSGGFGPLAFAQGYDMPVQHQIPGQPSGTTYDGHGQTAGIEIPADPADSDLAKFLSEYKITRTGTTTRVPVNGGPVNPSGGSLLEAALDYETIAGVAPGANIDIFEFPTFTSRDVLDGYNAAVNANTADSVNSSFGACEVSGIFAPRSIDKIFRQGVALGIVFHSSSGDSGTATYGCSNQVSVLTPTDSPLGFSIGGTRLNVDASGNCVSESYWDDSKFDAGGGGVSSIFYEHRWQKRAGIGEPGRALPDLSFDADPNSGEAMVFQGSFLTVGGTSLASPIFGGCINEVEQVMGGHRSHRPYRKLYAHWHADGYSSGSLTFAHDITTGTPYGPLKPGPGYDLATGIGSLDCFVGGPKYFYHN